MAKVLVSSLREDQDVVGFFIVRGRQLRSFRDRAGSVLALRLGDKSGEIDAKVWEDTEKLYEQLKAETVVKVQARTQLYNGRLELNVNRVRVARDDEFAVEDLLPVSTRNPIEMLDEFEAVIRSIGNEYLTVLLAQIFEGQMLREFRQAPAAKLVHHAYLGGLLEHTLEVVKFCETAHHVYKGVDRDLLLVGALLHDIGKIREYVYRRSIDFTDEGRLLGHIVLGEELLVERARQIPNFPEELLLRLRHLILSHHGQYEWQSPKRPKTIEACILHLADFFSGQVAIFDASIKAGDPNASWTDYNRYLQRAVFIGNGPVQPMPGDGAGLARHIFEEPYQGY